MLRVDKVIKPWKESAALNDHINLYGFWNETAFLTKGGDVGMVLSVPGVDYESLDRSEQEYAVKRLESALKAFGPGFHVYQYLFKSNRPDIPFARYDDPVVEAVIEQRRRFFEAKRDHLYQVEIFYCILLEGARSKTGVGAAFGQLFRDPAGAIGELKAQFTNNNMKTLLRSQIERDVARLDQRVQAFARQLADFMQIEILDRQGQFTFFRRLQTAVHAVSRLSSSELQYRSRARSSARRRSHRPCADNERGHRRNATSGAGCATKDPGQLPSRYGVDAARGGQGPKGGQQAPPPYSHPCSSRL
jgi:type IV secretory pathway VirB4 component